MTQFITKPELVEMHEARDGLYEVVHANGRTELMLPSVFDEKYEEVDDDEGLYCDRMD